MTTFTETARAGEHIMWDMPDYSRDQVTYASGNSIAVGQVVKGPDTAVIPAVAADTTGLFLSYRAVDATAAAKRDVACKRLTVVNGNLIVYPAGATTPQKAAIDAALLAAGIVVRR